MRDAAQAAGWLRGLDACLATGRLPHERHTLTDAEALEEEQLRATAGPLPLDGIVADAELDGFDVEALLVCAAVELDARWGAAVGFIADNPSRRRPTVGLLASLSATLMAELPARRQALGRLGRLRRAGLLRALPAALELDEELLLCPRVLAVLLGTERATFRDPLQIDPGAVRLPEQLERARVERLAAAMRDGTVAVVGIWGPRHSGRSDVVRALAAAQHRRLRRPASFEPQALAEAIGDAAALDALLWIDTDLVPDAQTAHLGEALARGCALACLTGTQPLRPATLLAARPWAELTLPAASFAARRALWSQALPELAGAITDDFAARFRLDGDEVTAVARTARAGAALARNGHVPPLADFVEPACTQVLRKRSHSLARLIQPRRGAEDLVLPAELHRQVMELADTFRAWPRGRASMRARTAERGRAQGAVHRRAGDGQDAIGRNHCRHPRPAAHQDRSVASGVEMGRRNREEPRDGVPRSGGRQRRALLRRGGVTVRQARATCDAEPTATPTSKSAICCSGSRTYEGLVILASNLKEEIDDAFTRRLHAILHFPRPAERERRRLWDMALPPTLPRGEVDLSVLARIDLTGAGIFAAARTAALRMAKRRAHRLEADDIVDGIAQQLQREARLLTASDLGPYAHLWRRTA